MYGSQGRGPDVLELRRAGGRWLRELRETASLTQAELAQRLGMQVYTFISQLENGRGRIPPDRYEAWALALGVEVRDFVRQILSYYDPVTFEILFAPAERSEGDLIVGRSLMAPFAPRTTELEALRSELSQLQRVLGKKTVELELLRERVCDVS
jgi:transcriptional regulator with XRE-family HTH domain